jgi:hypothetical protein
MSKQWRRMNKDDEDDENETYKKKRSTELPLPMNGKEYGMGEFLDFVTTTTAVNLSERGGLIQAIHYVKVGHNCIYWHLKAHYEGTAAYALNEPWSQRGSRPKIWSNTDIEAHVMKVKSMQNVKHTLKDLIWLRL